ncbi:MAG: hypothetical protein K0R54_2075 [Clostridiaceae bacterium]|jgi:hypothetical protein|nr:hypothetical protein [Clostridiaceae bacterium]
MNYVCVICDGINLVFKIRETAEELQKIIFDYNDSFCNGSDINSLLNPQKVQESVCIIEDYTYSEVRRILLKINKISAIYDVAEEIKHQYKSSKNN